MNAIDISQREIGLLTLIHNLNDSLEVYIERIGDHVYIKW